MKVFSHPFFPFFSLLFALMIIGCGEQSLVDEDAKTGEGAEDICVGRADGHECGDDSICVAARCGPSICGDGHVDAARGEECDDRNVTSGDGCESDCRFSCRMNAECQDGNFCNGEERCIEAGFGKLCAPALAPLDCDRGEACTTYRCDPSAERLEDACIAEEIDTALARCWRDADSDGHPSFAPNVICDGEACSNGVEFTTIGSNTCACPAGFIAATEDVTPEDCADDDALVYPGAPELCGDNKDNDCDGRVDSDPANGNSLKYYCSRDVDQDGFPDADAQGAVEIHEGYDCVCTSGSRAINHANISRADCDYTNNSVNPGVTAYSEIPYCPREGKLATPTMDESTPFSCQRGEPLRRLQLQRERRART